MEKTITTKEAVALLNALHWPSEIIDSPVTAQAHSFFRVAVRNTLKKYNDATKANREAYEELIKPFREQAQPVQLAKAELEAKGKLTNDEKALLEALKVQLDAIGVLANNTTKEVDTEFAKINEEHEKKKLLLVCNDEDYNTVKGKILGNPQLLFKTGLKLELFDADRYEEILNIFK